MERWIVILGGEVPEAYGLYGSEEAAERAAVRWNAEHPDDEYGA